MIPPFRNPLPDNIVSPRTPMSHPYPHDWERVAELRVFRTTPQEWARLLGWRAEMKRKGWRLLQVSSAAEDMVAVFGRTKEELLERKRNTT